MHKTFLILIAAIIFCSQSYAQSQGVTENWECALNLHQGDTGTLTLYRTDDSLEGTISFNRNESTFESNVSGSWVNDKITLKRIIGSDSSEDMSGLTIILGAKKVNIGGRFSTDYQGVWSADCDLVSEAPKIDTDATDSKILPSTSSRIRPNSPTNSDSITFSALASHPDGIETISFYLGDKQIHSCGSDRCEFKYGRLAAGNYNWRVEATSTNGIKSSQDSNRLVVSSDAESGNCTISGRAYGQSAPLAEIYLAKLYGPNNTDLLKSTSSFENGLYQFTNLPTGDYYLIIDTQGDQEILATPEKTSLSCQSKASVTQDIEFR